VSAKNEWGLTPQQEKFAQGVASGKSLSDAYRFAYKASRMKPQTINDTASKLMANPEITHRVKSLQAIGAEIAGLDAAKIAAEIARVAHSDIAGIMHPDGKVKLPHELDAATRAAVSSFKIDEYGRIEYKFWDKNTALTNGAKIVGLFKEDNKQKNEGAAEFLKALQSSVVGVVKGSAKDDEDDDE
jgi:hypothetical protein